MTYVLAAVAFMFAAIFALAGVKGLTLTEIAGIISIGLVFLTLALAGVGSGWGPGNWNTRRTRGPVA
jgi:hypothetical protein